jgi:hypothetical protein
MQSQQYPPGTQENITVFLSRDLMMGKGKELELPEGPGGLESASRILMKGEPGVPPMQSTLTCVSCYFPVKNKHDNRYNSWFENTLSINCPYVFFCSKNSIEYIQQFRKNLLTYYIECEIEDFHTYQYRDRMTVHPHHCPSIELNLIWNEKVFFVKKAAELNPFGSEWFHWIDAGICIYRNEKPPDAPFPNENILNELPKDKFICSSSHSHYNKHHDHHIAGTSYLLHCSKINEIIDKYQECLDSLVDTSKIWTDQVILTHIYEVYPYLFHIACDGYGESTRYLYS